MAGSKFAVKRRVDCENRQFKEEWTECYAFILPPTSARPMCLICQETVALVKSGNLKRHYETKLILKIHTLKIQTYERQKLMN